MKKTVKQIRNLKAVKDGARAQVWDATMADGSWNWGWFDLDDFETNNDRYFSKATDKIEYQIFC